LAIILVLAVGGVVAGIPGAIIAVPMAAALTRAAPHLAGQARVGSLDEPAAGARASPRPRRR
ncbi:MAG: AI-2E family transporter, partial [Actinobacteria bacterium]|nr:AI-2E family transporter [Actinomycetota bacterium]